MEILGSLLSHWSLTLVFSNISSALLHKKKHTYIKKKKH